MAVKKKLVLKKKTTTKKRVHQKPAKAISQDGQGTGTPKKKRAVGRPSKYSPALQAKADKYIDNYSDYGDAVPSIAGLAVVLGVRRETLHQWADDPTKEIFSNTVGRLLATQERKLLSGGLSGDYNSTIAKLLLHNHGYSDKSSNEHTGEGGGPVDLTWTVRVMK